MESRDLAMPAGVEGGETTCNSEERVRLKYSYSVKTTPN